LIFQLSGIWRRKYLFVCRHQLKCDGRRWRMGGEVKGKLANGVTSTLHTISEHGISSITTANAHNSAASSRLNWRPRRFKWTRPFRRRTKSGFCACAITFQLACTKVPVEFAASNFQGISKGFFKALIFRPPCIYMKTEHHRQYLLRTAVLVDLSALYVYWEGQREKSDKCMTPAALRVGCIIACIFSRTWTILISLGGQRRGIFALLTHNPRCPVCASRMIFKISTNYFLIRALTYWSF